MGGILWLASYPKSGNTWVRAFLANLFANQPGPLDINELNRFAVSDQRVGEYETLTGRAYDAIEDEEVNRLRPQAQRMIAASRPETVLCKTHSKIAVLKGAPTVEPGVTTGAVYVLRNPLDVAPSYADHFGIDLDTAITYLCDPNNHVPRHDRLTFVYLGSWQDHASSWLDAPGLRCHFLRYEDLLAEPRRGFGSLVRFLGLPADPKRFERALRFSSFGVLRRLEEQSGFVERSPNAERFFRSGRAGAWREIYTPAQLDRLIEGCRDGMRRFGYLDDRDRPVETALPLAETPGAAEGETAG